MGIIIMGFNHIDFSKRWTSCLRKTSLHSHLYLVKRDR